MRKVDRALLSLRQAAGRTPLGSESSTRKLTPLPVATRPVVTKPGSASIKLSSSSAGTRQPLGSTDAQIKQTRRGVYKVEGYSYRDARQHVHALTVVQGAGSSEYLGAWQLHRGKPEGSKTLLHTAESLENLRSDVARGRVHSVAKGYGGRNSRLAGKEKPARGKP